MLYKELCPIHYLLSTADLQVEKLLVEAEESRHSRAPAALERQCQLLERLAGEAARLHYNTTRGQVCAACSFIIFLSRLHNRSHAAQQLDILRTCSMQLAYPCWYEMMLSRRRSSPLCSPCFPEWQLQTGS